MAASRSQNLALVMLSWALLCERYKCIHWVIGVFGHGVHVHGARAHRTCVCPARAAVFFPPWLVWGPSLLCGLVGWVPREEWESLPGQRYVSSFHNHVGHGRSVCSVFPLCFTFVTDGLERLQGVSEFVTNHTVCVSVQMFRRVSCILFGCGWSFMAPYVAVPHSLFVSSSRIQDVVGGLPCVVRCHPFRIW